MKTATPFPWLIAVIAIAVVGAYWHLWAEDRYVSRATVVLESPEIAPPSISFGGLLGGGAGEQRDLLLLREHLLSVDMLNRVTAELPFREHYSQNGDWFSRLRDIQAPTEDLHRYFKRRAIVDMDDYPGVLRIEVQAFEPEFALKLAELLLAAGEEHMNHMGQRLAEEQVHFLEIQVERLHDRMIAAHNDLLAFQNREGLVSPTQTIEAFNQIIARLEGELASLQAKRKAMASYQSQASSEMVRTASEIDALREQIQIQRDRLAQATGESLNRISAEYEALALQAEFARETYSRAIAALENTRIEAARKLKQVSVLQSPSTPEYPIEPKRTYNTVVFALLALFAALIAHMLLLIIRDHRD